jgi:hypothetical protein
VRVGELSLQHIAPPCSLVEFPEKMQLATVGEELEWQNIPPPRLAELP